MHLKSILRMLSAILMIVSLFILACGFFSITEKNQVRVIVSFFIPAGVGLAFFSFHALHLPQGF